MDLSTPVSTPNSMKPTTRRGILSGLFLAALLAGCRSSPGNASNHWNIESLVPRVGYHFFGYRKDLDGSYREHQWREKQDITLTLRRHFLNNNPENPFEAEDTSISAPRPYHSVLPNPLGYFHLESIASGLAITAATGTFVPIPVGSLIGTLEPGGLEEFGKGIGTTVTGSFGHTLGEPPSVEEFRVRHN